MLESSKIMSSNRISRFGFVLLVIFGRLTCANESPRVCNSICPPKSIKDSIFSFQVPVCPLNRMDNSFGVIEGDETSLQKALSKVHRNAQDYVVVLFYASWCPFSITFRPSLSVMSSLYPSIAHFAIEESVIRPRKHASTRNVFGVSHHIRDSEVGLPELSVYRDMCSSDLEEKVRKHTVQEFVGPSFRVLETCDTVIQVAHRALQAKQSAWSDERQGCMGVKVVGFGFFWGGER
ncbi:hypothetical protein Ccrd_014351 [Cynara cardunculus var. scolymus]|uniref:Thioredoxin domain-containing protein n=1 Tax=Cynara cardunculus var. scolymus TaxID=59895 RepID=A0A103YDZ6_CYNCS|nr:hypothetical protein Ccrd_014351 [Cynara cardunculus var. scolymus]